MRLIDASAKSNLLYVSQEAFEQMQRIPADKNLVRVVRCKECLYRKERLNFGDLQCGILGVPMNDHDFCSYGERKENHV